MVSRVTLGRVQWNATTQLNLEYDFHFIRYKNFQQNNDGCSMFIWCAQSAHICFQDAKPRWNYHFAIEIVSASFDVSIEYFVVFSFFLKNFIQLNSIRFLCSSVSYVVILIVSSYKCLSQWFPFISNMVSSITIWFKRSFFFFNFLYNFYFFFFFFISAWN